MISKLFDHRNHLNEEGIAWYAEHLVNNELNKLPDKILEHVGECQQCKVQCIEIAGILRLQMDNEAEDNAPGEDVKPPGLITDVQDTYRIGKQRKQMNYWLPGIAAGVIILFGVGWLIMKGLKSNREDTSMLAQQITTTDTTQHKIVNISGIDFWVQKWAAGSPGLEESFTVNPKLESILKLMFRSHDFIMEKPDSISELRQGKYLLFQWEDKKSKEFTLKIMNNQGTLIHKRVLKHHSTYEVRKNLKPGLYYWFIEQSSYTIAGGRVGVLQDQ